MVGKNWVRHQGVAAALLAAILFGAGTPLAKLLLHSVSPWLLAGLLYLGSGSGLALYRRLSHAPAVSLPRQDRFWLAGAVLAGGVIAPILLMMGLTHMQAASASLLLNAEGVLTTLLAWFAFRENFDRRIALGMLSLLAGAMVLSWPSQAHFAGLWPTLAVLGACFAWAIDNNLTRKVALNDASWIASVKGLVAGPVNLILACALGARIPSLTGVLGAMTVGFVAYGVSLVMFIVGLRHLGTARTGAYFSIAPFVGAALAIAMGEPLTLPLLIAGALMLVGLALHLTEQHAHEHVHEEQEHEHEHVHDEHHQHTHPEPVPAGTRHRHRHQHAALKHGHPHYPDMHHRHSHS